MRLRSLARPILKHLVAPIDYGPNKGLLCSRACGRAYRIGVYEQGRWESLGPTIEAGEVFWHAGAHYGYVTLLAHRAVGPEGRVIAFEPHARNRWFARKHLAANRVANADLFPWALSNFTGTAKFGGGRGSGTKRLGAGHATAEVRSVDALVVEGLRAPTWLKIDVEGGESALLEGAADTLAHRPVLVLVATHSAEQHTRCLELLTAYGYACHVPDRAVATLAAGEGEMDTEILAVGPGRVLDPAHLQAFLTADVYSHRDPSPKVSS